MGVNGVFTTAWITAALVGLAAHGSVSLAAETGNGSTTLQQKETFEYLILGPHAVIVELRGPAGARWTLNLTLQEHGAHDEPTLHAVKVLDPRGNNARIVQWQSGTEPLFVGRVGDMKVEPTVNIDPVNGTGWALYGSRIPESGVVVAAFSNLVSETLYEYRGDSSIDFNLTPSTRTQSTRGIEYSGPYVRANAILAAASFTGGSATVTTSQPSIAWFPAEGEDAYGCTSPSGSPCGLARTTDVEGAWKVTIDGDVDRRAVEWYDFLVAEFPAVPRQ